MNALGAGAFWDRVKTTPPEGDKETQYEDFAQLPYQFLSAGPYPDDEMGVQWYLRVVIDTADESGAGTDADVWLHAGDRAPHLLDYLPRANPLLSYDDFEAGDQTVYTVGPFDGMPPNYPIHSLVYASINTSASWLWTSSQASPSLVTVGLSSSAYSFH